MIPAYRAALAVFTISSGLASAAWASDQIGVYARVGKVVVQGTRVTICGAFRVANTAGDYQAAASGYLYYECVGDAAAQAMCQMQWTEIAKGVAGQNCVGWGNRHGTYGEDNKNSQVRTALPLPAPNSYPIEMGVVQMPNTGSGAICDSLKGLSITHAACDAVNPDMAHTTAGDMAQAPGQDLAQAPSQDMATTPPPKSGCSAAPGAALSGGGVLGLGLLALGLLARRRGRTDS